MPSRQFLSVMSAPKSCEPGAYCEAGASNPAIATAGTYTDEARTQSFTCEPGHYCINGIKRKCAANRFGSKRGLKSDTCSGKCLTKNNEYSTEAATQCSCLPTFVNVSDGSGCVCPPGTYRAEDACNPCPHGLVKSTYGDALALCEPPQISITSAFLYGGLTFACALIALFLARAVRKGSIYESELQEE